MTEFDFVARAFASGKECGLDRSQSLTDAALRHLEYYLSRHSPAGAELSTLETGGGVSTILFARYARRHVVHLLDSEGATARSDFVRRLPGLSSEALQISTERLEPERDRPAPPPTLDIVLIDGARAYPIPDLEFLAATQRLKPGGVLVLDDIDIPTIHRLFEFIAQDAMFYLNDVVEGTAFFARSEAQSFDADRGAWQQQAFNAQRYPAFDWTAYQIGYSLPLAFKYDGRLNSLPDYCARGFSLSWGRPATDGAFSMIRIPLEKAFTGNVAINLDLEAVAPAVRPAAGVMIDIDKLRHGPFYFNGAARQTFVVNAALKDCKRLLIDLISVDPRLAKDLSPASGDIPESRRPNVILHGIEIRLADQQEGQPTRRLASAEGAIVSFDHNGQTIRFFVENPHDSIQAHHNVGEFYEPEELNLIARHVPRNARILDIGANIGNHTVWFEKVMGAAAILPVEPQGRVVELLKTNCLLNRLKTIDESCLGLAFGRRSGTGDIQIDQAFNVAGARVEASENGRIRIENGDQMVAGRKFDFIKIDVEGAEIDVIEGLEKLIRRCRPIMFVEVWNENRERFDVLMKAFDLLVVEEFRRYDIATNLMVKPRSNLTPRNAFSRFFGR